jgi:serine/threonine protein kinase/cytochrome c-type biogenesis protein CcmH/NrfG
MLERIIGGRYQIIRPLGGGGFGQTFLAEDWHLPGKPKCVVKQLKPQVDNPEALQVALRLFDREAEVLYTLGTHDRIPQLFAHFEEQTEFYLVQEFVDGKVISQEIKEEGAFSASQVVEFMQDVFETLAFVHRQQVIHRDIKPSNLIRRNSDGRIVVIDFGAVKQIGNHLPTNEEDEATFTMAVGSSGYMPNEQLAGRPRYSSDVYSVGMVGIQMLTGLSPAQLRYDPRTGEILWRDRVNDELDTNLADVLDQMVRYDYRQRYQTAEEVLDAFQNLIAPRHDTVILPTAASAAKAVISRASRQETSTVVGASSSPLSDTHLIWFERGDELFQQQRYRKAIECYDKVIEMVPDNYLVWFKRGIAFENLQQYTDAVDCYERVIELQPEDYLAWFKRGKALENLRRYADASIAYEKVIQIQPDNYWAWHDRGKVLEASGEFESAVEAYERAVQLKPDFQLAVDSRKRVLTQLKQVDRLYHLQHYDEAVAACDRTLRDEPNNALAWLMRGMALENLKQYRPAVQSYSQVVKLQPDDHLSWLKLGNLLERLQKLKEAAAAYGKVVQLQPENQWAWHDRGRALEKLHLYEKALASYEKALRVNPDFQSAVEGRQRSLLNIRKQAQASAQSAAKPQ